MPQVAVFSLEAGAPFGDDWEGTVTLELPGPGFESAAFGGQARKLVSSVQELRGLR